LSQGVSAEDIRSVLHIPGAALLGIQRQDAAKHLRSTNRKIDTLAIGKAGFGRKPGADCGGFGADQVI
jgi:hypothetical protein